MSKKLSINKLSLLTGRSRQHVTRRVARLESTDGKWGAKLYDPADAIPAILAVGEMEQLRIAAHRERTLLLRAQEEVRSGKRIPLELLTEWLDHALKTMRSRIMASLGKPLNDERIEWILEEWSKLREKVENYPKELAKKRARGGFPRHS